MKAVEWVSLTQAERDAHVASFATLREWEEEFDNILLDMLSVLP